MQPEFYSWEVESLPGFVDEKLVILRDTYTQEFMLHRHGSEVVNKYMGDDRYVIDRLESYLRIKKTLSEER